MQTTTAQGLSTEVRAAAQRITEQVRSVVAVDEQTVRHLLMALFARGHALVEGIPGTGKTLLVRTLARSVDCDFSRIQFTNDLMPSDIVGTMVWQQKAEQFRFVRGPLFHNLVLADEINRTSPRTLSCLLEAMENGRVSIEGRQVELANPFLVLATRNPIEFHGTYPIPEAALDRFLVRVALDYPKPEQELSLYLGENPERRLDDVQPVMSRDELLAAMHAVQQVTVQEPVARYAQRVVQATREHASVLLGASPRAALMWLSAARALALLSGREYVLPDDLQQAALAVLAHRIFLKGAGDAKDLVAQLLDQTPVEL